MSPRDSQHNEASAERISGGDKVEGPGAVRLDLRGSQVPVGSQKACQGQRLQDSRCRIDAVESSREGRYVIAGVLPVSLWRLQLNFMRICRDLGWDLPEG